MRPKNMVYILLPQPALVGVQRGVHQSVSGAIVLSPNMAERYLSKIHLKIPYRNKKREHSFFLNFVFSIKLACDKLRIHPHFYLHFSSFFLPKKRLCFFQRENYRRVFGLVVCFYPNLFSVLLNHPPLAVTNNYPNRRFPGIPSRPPVRINN